MVSEANRRDHWFVKRRRQKEQQEATHAALITLGADIRARLIDSPTITVRFVRIGGKRLDSDNLVSGFKAIRDALAKWLRVDDGSDRLKWEWPVQEYGERAVRIELSTGEV